MAGKATHILAIDQGTTGTTVLILDRDLRVLSRAYREFEQHYPQPGWVEHEPEDIWQTVRETVPEALAEAGIDASQLAGIGITNQRETTVVWERAGVGRFIGPSSGSVADHRAVRRAEGRGLEDEVRKRTGLVLDPYFRNEGRMDSRPRRRARSRAGPVSLPSAPSTPSWCGASPAGLPTSRTSRMHPAPCCSGWSPSAGRTACSRSSMCCEVCRRSALVGGLWRHEWPGLPAGRHPRGGNGGRPAAALFGQLCFEEAEAKCTYGTGALLMNTGSGLSPPSMASHHGGVEARGRGRLRARGQCLHCGAAAVASRWARADRDRRRGGGAGRQVPDSGGVTFVPALTGLGAPTGGRRPG